MARVPLSAISSSSGEIQVYSRDVDGSTVFRTFSTSWSSASTVTDLGSGYEFSVTQWDNLEHIRVFHQDFESVVRSMYSDNGGSSWSAGSLVVN